MWRGDPAWSNDDSLLAVANTMFEAATCNQCGRPLSVCRDSSNSFEVTEDTCQATAAVERHKRDMVGDPEPGVVLTPVLDDSPAVYGGPPPGWGD